MRKSVLAAGATGLIGNAFLETAASENKLSRVIVLTRRDIPSIKNNHLFEQNKINFDRLPDYKRLIKADIVVCTLGTTIKKAGSKDEFRKIDYGLPLMLAGYASENGCKYFVLVSSVGASPGSFNFYLKVKGDLERDIQKLSFKGIHILRPSLLLGNRNENRPGETGAQKLSKLYSPLLPAKFKPVEAKKVAEKIHRICIKPADGIHIYQGNDLLKD